MASLVVSSVEEVALDTYKFELRDAHGAPLPAGAPGSHITLSLPNGLYRSYSLIESGGGESGMYQICVKREANGEGGSAWICDNLSPGMELEFDPPRNNFPLVEDAPNSLFFAGGIGITPIRSMIKKLELRGGDWELYFGCQTRAAAAFVDELSKYEGANLHFDDEAKSGFIDMAGLIAGAKPGTHVYCCGPAPMLEAFEAASKSMPTEQVHLEYFGTLEEASTEGGFEVELARSNKLLEISPGQTILEAVHRAGVDAPSSCEQGVCGSCETDVIQGVPDHRDAVLSREEREANETMMICCSGSKSAKLVLDI